MIKGTANNYVRFSKSWGGVRKAYEGHEAPWMLQGGFKFPSLDVLPASGNVLPAFTPVKVDEQARTIVPMYAFKVVDVDSDNTAIAVEKFEEGTRAKVGMKLIVAPAAIGTAAGDVMTVTAIDGSDSDVDILTLDKVSGDVYTAVADPTGQNPKTKGWYELSDGSYVATEDTEPVAEKTYYEKSSALLVAEGDVVIEAGSDKKVKVVPNTLIPYDTCVDEDAFALDGEACWGATSSILERRIPVIPDVIKAALKDAGCVFRFSNRK